MARPKGSPDVAPMIRGAFKRAALRLDIKGKGLSELIEESLEKDVLNTLRAISCFVPKELEIRKTPTRLEDMNDDELEQIRSLAASIISDFGEGEAGESKVEPDSIH